MGGDELNLLSILSDYAGPWGPYALLIWAELRLARGPLRAALVEALGFARLIGAGSGVSRAAARAEGAAADAPPAPPAQGA